MLGILAGFKLSSYGCKRINLAFDEVFTHHSILWLFANLPRFLD